MPASVPATGSLGPYGGTVALDGVDLTVPAGTAVAVLGPNGTGTSTLVEILEGHRRRVPVGQLRLRRARHAAVPHRHGPPLRHLQDAMSAAYAGEGIAWGGLAVPAAWGLLGAAVAAARWPRRT